MKLNFLEKKKFEACFIKVCANVRYWEDASINGEISETSENVPFAKGDNWEPVIDIEKGILLDWPQGTTASFHFKVCDAGEYHLLDADKNIVASIAGYVPSGLCHGDQGYGDYIIFDVDQDGQIKGYSNGINPEDWIEEE